MGCINSKNNLSEIRPNIYKVDSIDEDGATLWHGQLEVCPNELVLHRKQKEPTKWSLKHLRRYGVDSNLFTFEAGRRCKTGEGIYAFRCNRAESLCRVLQTYIEGIASNDETNNFLQNNTNAGADPISETINNLRQQQALLSNRSIVEQSCSQHGTSSHNIDISTHEENYLEPIPTQSILQRYSGGRFGSVGSSGPISPEIESSESLHSFTIIPELVQKPNYSNGNVYQEVPIKSQESNNNALGKNTLDNHTTMSVGTTISCNDVVNPAVGSDDHMYVNVTLGEDNITSPTLRFLHSARPSNIDDSMRSYANINLIRPELNNKPELSSVTSNEKSVPSTPLEKDEPVGVNYIELDLDQSPSSQLNSVQKLTTTINDKFEAGTVNNSIKNITKENTFHSLTKSLSTGSGISSKNFNCNNNQKLVTKSTSQTRSIASGHLSPDSPKIPELEYAKIDINKTLALSNTTATNAELESKGARRTRHSSCVRQSNSISD